MDLCLLDIWENEMACGNVQLAVAFSKERVGEGLWGLGATIVIAGEFLSLSLSWRSLKLKFIYYFWFFVVVDHLPDHKAGPGILFFWPDVFGDSFLTLFLFLWLSFSFLRGAALSHSYFCLDFFFLSHLHSIFFGVSTFKFQNSH